MVDFDIIHHLAFGQVGFKQSVQGIDIPIIVIDGIEDFLQHLIGTNIECFVKSVVRHNDPKVRIQYDKRFPVGFDDRLDFF
nr:hypothetical protein [Desulfatitalea tepidiphila]